MKRPPPSLRVAILIAAVACLGLAMCARTPSSSTTPPPPANAGPQAPEPAAPPDAAPEPATPRIDSFPATKAPGRLY